MHGERAQKVPEMIVLHQLSPLPGTWPGCEAAAGPACCARRAVVIRGPCPLPVYRHEATHSMVWCEE